MRRRPARALILAALCACAAPVSGDTARHLDSHPWREDSADFGGLSGIVMSADGLALTAISDRGSILRASVLRDGDTIRRVTLDSLSALHGPDGKTLRPNQRDAEGITQQPDGTLCISFEGPARILCTAPGASRPTRVPDHPAFAGLQGNSALEALASDARGRLYTLPERSGAPDRPFPVWRWDGRRWDQPFSIPRSAGFLAVGADIGPDGRFYLLERAFNGIAFRSRLRSFDITGDRLRDTRTHLDSPILRHDNLEGLSVWRDAQGRIRLSMVSDDNFRRLQRSEIVEYVID